MRTLTIVVIVALIVGAIIGAKFYFFPADQGNTAALPTGKKANQPLGVDILVLKETKIDNNLEVSGTILPNERVDLAAEASGRVTGIYFKEGSVVKQGQLLVKLNDADLKAQLQKAKVSLQLAQDRALRQEKLLQIQGTSKEDFDIAQNQVLTYKTDIQYYSTLIQKTEIRAPFSGVIGFRNIALGSFVSPSSIVASLQQLDPVKIEFSIPEKYLNDFKAGQSFEFVTESSKKIQQGKVQTIDPQIDLNTRSVLIRGIAPNKEALLAGNFVKVKLNLSNNTKGIQIPTSSVVPILKGQKVFIFKDGKAIEKEISISNRNEETVQVDSGLQVGDSLIVTGIIQLKEGVPVSPGKVN